MLYWVETKKSCSLHVFICNFLLKKKKSAKLLGGQVPPLPPRLLRAWYLSIEKEFHYTVKDFFA